MTYCTAEYCKNKKCEHHICHAPKGESWFANMCDVCEYYIRQLLEEVEKERIR